MLSNEDGPSWAPMAEGTFTAQRATMAHVTFVDATFDEVATAEAVPPAMKSRNSSSLCRQDDVVVAGVCSHRFSTHPLPFVDDRGKCLLLLHCAVWAPQLELKTRAEKHGVIAHVA